MLLEEMLPSALRQLVTICINPSGVSGDGLSRVEEHAFFCFCGGAQPSRLSDDLFGITEGPQDATTGWESLLRRGNVWYREKRKNLCYPVLIDSGNKIVGVGTPFSGDDESTRETVINGNRAACAPEDKLAR